MVYRLVDGLLNWFDRHSEVRAGIGLIAILGLLVFLNIIFSQFSGFILLAIILLLCLVAMI